MVSKRISAGLFLAAILLGCLWILSGLSGEGSSFPYFYPEDLPDGSFMEGVEEYAHSRFPFIQQIRSFSVSLQRGMGRVEFDGIFVTSGRLIYNLPKEDEEKSDANTAAVLSFSRNSPGVTYAVIVPSAAVISQRSLPTFATPYDQKDFIDQTYRLLSKGMNCIDVYQTLFQHQDQYIYYRTSSDLTSLGGYYLYTDISARLGHTPLPLSRFDIQYLSDRYAGALYEQSDYKGVQLDVLAIYRPNNTTGQGTRQSQTTKEFVVTHFGETTVTYNTLYPRHTILLGEETNIYLGGMSPVIQIESVSSLKQNLLVFGDSTALAYLPFLAQHYSRITFCDMETVSAEQYHALKLFDYAQVLFVFSAETYMHTEIPARIAEITK